MAIRVSCPGCSKIIIADDHDAGRRARCPECHASLTLPAPDVHQAPPLSAAEAFVEEDFAESIGVAGRPEQVVCPYCAETIRYNARKCRHCGEYLDDDLRRQHRRAAGAHPFSAGAKPHAGIAAVLSLFFPGAGQIYREKIGVGIAWMVAVAIGYVLLVVPGLILHGICIYDAASNE